MGRTPHQPDLPALSLERHLGDLAHVAQQHQRASAFGRVQPPNPVIHGALQPESCSLPNGETFSFSLQLNEHVQN